jgi:hypothetical protein
VVTGLALFGRAPVAGRYLVDLLPALLPLGIGGGLSFPALGTLAMSEATPEDSGLASGLVNTTAQVGSAFGLAVLATVSTARTHALLAQGHPGTAALVGGYRLAFGISAGLAATALVLAATVLRRPVAPVPGPSAPPVGPGAAARPGRPGRPPNVAHEAPERASV